MFLFYFSILSKILKIGLCKWRMGIREKDFMLFNFRKFKSKRCIRKRTVSVISCDPPCKSGNSRFTTVPLKSLSDQVWIRSECFCFSAKVTCKCLVFPIPLCWSFKCFNFKDTVVNRQCHLSHGGSL